MYKFGIVFFLSFVSLCTPQACRTRGEWCEDTKICCGGCCIANVCIDSYEDCRLTEDPCLDEYCPGDAVCRIYRPACEGCDIERRCIFVNQNSEEFSMDPKVLKASGSAILGSHIRYLVLILFMCKYVF